MEKLYYLQPEETVRRFSLCFPADVGGIVFSFLEKDDFYYEKKELTCLGIGIDQNNTIENILENKKDSFNRLCPRCLIVDFTYVRSYRGIEVRSDKQKHLCRRRYSGQPFLNMVTEGLQSIYEGETATSLRDYLSLLINHWGNMSKIENDIEVEVEEDVDRNIKNMYDPDHTFDYYYQNDDGYFVRQRMVDETQDRISGFRELQYVCNNLPTLALKVIQEYIRVLKAS